MALGPRFPGQLKLGILFLLLCLPASYQDERCIDTFGLEGRCKPAKECPYMHKLSKGINASPCFSTGVEPIVCCTKPEEYTSAFSILRGPSETARFWCEKYKDQCPKRFDSSKDLPTEFPHMAAIGYGDFSNVKWKCGGTLISEKFILTPARCLSIYPLGRAQWVLLGTEINRFQFEVVNNGQIHPVVRRIAHPRYIPPTKYDDIGLIEIGTAMSENPIPTISRYLHPACLPTKDWGFETSNAMATEWSYVEYGDITNTDLLVGEMSLMSSLTCNRLFEKESQERVGLHRGIDYSMMCGRVRRGKRQDCNVDSGGQLQFAIWTSCMYQIWGVNSFWKNCTLSDPSSVYVRVHEYIPWIQSYVWP
ncbi:serine protease snake-like [Ischnura elegans]|uniref:serine protease snake-like n=1 Tax=Ischnura elegans TaxID=197161 RepID=UPI001ED87E3C|nr:serine protease snake-like [Ischnura elegans]